MANTLIPSSDEHEAPETIVLVDDHPTDLRVLFQTLNGRGTKLLIAQNGEEALAIARKAHPALILLDIIMPGIDGFETMAFMKHGLPPASYLGGSGCARR